MKTINSLLRSKNHLLSQCRKLLTFAEAVKRKALDVIDDTNKRVVKDVTPVRGTGLIAALAKTNSFVETGGQVMIDGEVFDEADFDDIGMSDWEAPLKVWSTYERDYSCCKQSSRCRG